MFGLFKKTSPLEKLQQQYQRLMEEAMHLQRNGDIKGYAVKVEQAEEVAKEITRLKASA